MSLYCFRFAVAFVLMWQYVAALHSQLHFSRHSGHAIALCDVTCPQITGYSDPVLKQHSLKLGLIAFIKRVQIFLTVFRTRGTEADCESQVAFVLTLKPDEFSSPFFFLETKPRLASFLTIILEVGHSRELTNVQTLRVCRCLSWD